MSWSCRVGLVAGARSIRWPGAGQGWRRRSFGSGITPYWVLHTSSGATRPCSSDAFHGFLSAFQGHDGDASVQRVAAVCADDAKLWFQVDVMRWEVGVVEFDHKLDASGVSRFTVLRYGDAVVDIMYRARQPTR